MQLQNLLRDATGAEVSASQRSQHIELVARLTAAYPSEAITLKGVEKWFARNSIPAKWLMRIATLTDPELNLSTYA